MNALLSTVHCVSERPDALLYSFLRALLSQGYPSIYFLPANNKHKPVLYTGGRQAGHMIQYLSQHRTTSVGKGSDLFGALLEDELKAKKNQRKGEL